MKKDRFAPVVRKVEFAYNEQVVASGEIFGACTIYYQGSDGSLGTSCKIYKTVGNTK